MESCLLIVPLLASSGTPELRAVQSSPLLPPCALRRQAPGAAVGQGVGSGPQGSLPDPAAGASCLPDRTLIPDRAGDQVRRGRGSLSTSYPATNPLCSRYPPYPLSWTLDYGLSTTHYPLPLLLAIKLASSY
jgi:hypothetical protein